MTVYSVGDADTFGVETEQITEFIQKEWARPVALSLPWFYDWQFRRGHEGEGKGNCVVLKGDNQEIFGFVGVTTRRFYMGDRVLRGCELTTWIFSQKVRGLGYGKAVVEHIQKSYDVIVGMGISDVAISIYTRAGIRFVQHIPRYVRIFNLEAVDSISEISRLGRQLVQQHSTSPSVPYAATPIELVESAEMAPSLYKNFHCLSRDVKYLQWRYADHPTYTYKSFRIESEGHVAAAIFRIEQKGGLRIVHVVDLFGDESAFSGVVAFLDGYCRDNDVDFADFSCTSHRIGHIFWYYGWFSMVDDFYVQVPNLFYPIEIRKPPTTSLILWSKYNMRSMLDQNRLYITKGDCDLDRPTINYLTENGYAL